MQRKQSAMFLVGVFVVLGILGLLAAVAIPHAREMSYRSHAHDKETELLRIRSAVDEMLQQSHGGKLESIGPVADLSLVHTADEKPLFLIDYLPEEVSSHLIPGCTYSFTADGVVMQMTN